MKQINKCSVCGYIYVGDKPPEECPFCHNPKSAFMPNEMKMIDYEFILDSWQKQVRWMNNTKYQFAIKLTEDQNVLKTLAESEINNIKEHGQAYCPCRIRENNKEADRKIICPCYLYMGEIELQGHCHCRLFLKAD